MVVRFHGFVLDTGRRTLTCGGRHVHLTRKAFDLLTMLVEEAPRVVSKSELHQRLWPDAFITDATLAGVVKELRRGLADREGAAPLIRTAHGVGYAFAGTLQPHDVDGVADTQCWLVMGTRRLMLGEGPNDIGRDPRVGLWLDGPLVSRRHARITLCEGVATLEDLGSKNCTLVNDRPVSQPTPLTNGDAIQIGSAILTFRVVNVAATTETAATGAES
jgi:DNA-binding winged helix-turn-helix (wHTH) protein